MKKNFINILYYIAMIGMIIWYSYSKGWIFANFENINASQAIILLQNDNNVSILDVRSVDEYKNGHIEDALLIPVEYLSENLGMLKEVKNKKLLVYCRSGNRSIIASRILAKNGFTPLNIKGGVIQLRANGVKLTK